MFDLSETYRSLSGEAPIIGEPVYLIRFSGCNLNCSYCDSKYASGTQNSGSISRTISEEDLTREIANVKSEYPSIKVLFTGGEPLFADRQEALIRSMKTCGNVSFYMETNGSIPISEFNLLNCTYVVDLKTPSSGEADSFHSDNFKRLRAGHDCIKIVLDDNDLPWVLEKIAFINSINPGLAIYLSPQWGKIALEKLASFILDNSLDAKMSIQLHKIIWGENTRGV